MTEKDRLETRTAFVSGGSKGIGLAVVRALVRAHYLVITCARDEASWQANVAAWPELAHTVDFRPCDLADQVALDALFSYIASTYGHIDVAVNNASPAIASAGQFSELSATALFDTLVSDLWVPAQCLRHELNVMRRPSTIINVSSINGHRPSPGAAMYGAAKHGLEALTKSVALEAIGKGIRVNAVAPGATWTARWEARVKAGTACRNDVEQMIPMKRFALAEEVAEAVLWLASDKSAYVVGHTLVVDGGLSLA